MGMSLSGDVFWGFDLGYDEDIDDEAMPQWWQDEQDWEEVLARRLGWVEAPHPPAPPGMDDRERQETPEFLAWAANRGEMHDLIKTVAAEIDSYGYEYGGRAVRVKASEQRCDYEAQRLTGLEVGPDWADQLTRFCELLEIPIPEEGPGWHLCATWA